MIPGLSTHMPESVIYDRNGLDVETYIQMYNAAGFMMQVEVDWVMRIIRDAKKPVMTIKPMAAGRSCHRRPGLLLEHHPLPGYGHGGHHHPRRSTR